MKTTTNSQDWRQGASPRQKAAREMRAYVNEQAAQATDNKTLKAIWTLKAKNERYLETTEEEREATRGYYGIETWYNNGRVKREAFVTTYYAAYALAFAEAHPEDTTRRPKGVTLNVLKRDGNVEAIVDCIAYGRAIVL